MSEPKALYNVGERAIFTEIYLPKKAAYQGSIFRALRLGLEEESVKRYLVGNLSDILLELKAYKNLLNPYHYEGDEKGKDNNLPTVHDAISRIEMCKSHFRGWSMYEVDGVWKANGGICEERTQVIRIMFRLPSAYEEYAKIAECTDVLRSMLYWFVASQGNLLEHHLWTRAEQLLFIKNHHPWEKGKLAFVRKYFFPVAKEVRKWKHDCGLFIFGWLVHRFSRNVLLEKAEEQEIWVTNLFNLNINVVEKTIQENLATSKGEMHESA